MWLKLHKKQTKKLAYMSLWQNMCFRRLLLLNEELSKKRGAVIKCARFIIVTRHY